MIELKEKYKIPLMTILLAVSSFLAYYFRAVLGTDIVFSHFFYIPVVLAALWWQRKGLVVAIFLAVLLILSHVFIKKELSVDCSLRAFMFIVIAFLVVILSERIIKSGEAMRKAREELGIRVQERTAELAKANEALQAEIAERKLVDKAVRESEERYRGLIEGARDVIFTLSTDGRITSLNPAFETITGWSRNDWIGKPFAPIINPDDLPVAMEIFQRVLQGEVSKTFELRILSKSGEYLIGEFATTPVIKDEKVIGVLGIARNITERKQKEEALKKLSTAVQQTADIVIITDKDDVIEYVNPAFEKLTGYTREEAIGKTPNILKSGKHDKKFYKKLYETIHSGRFFRAEIINKKKNGEIYLVASTITPIKDTQGNITHFVSTEKDITEHKKAEELRLENERLAYASKAKSEFLATMSHELRTPLNSIIGFSELLKQKMAGKYNEKEEHYVENVITSGKHLLNLINDILDLSKVEAGKIELVIEKVSLPAVIDESLTLIKENAVKHNVIIKKEIDPQLEIEADKQRFKQILFNLLDNAVKFSKKKGGIVTITAKKEGDTAKLSVSDTGIGIREEDMGKLFNEFVQIDSGISRKYGGTGLGLAISKKLVELQRGKIMVESKYGEGSTFTFLLPLKAKKQEGKDESSLGRGRPSQHGAGA